MNLFNVRMCTHKHKKPQNQTKKTQSNKPTPKRAEIDDQSDKGLGCLMLSATCTWPPKPAFY